MTTTMESTTVATPASVHHQVPRVTGYLSKTYAEHTSSQKLQIELRRLKFLKDCKTCKRPPPSIRIKGASAIKTETRMKLFSTWETELLDIAIKEKIGLTKNLRKQTRGQINVPLSDVDVKNMDEHFKEKLAFYMVQNKTKWKSWPNKTTKAKTTETNYKRRKKRRKKKTEESAKKAIDSGSVVVLVEKDVPEDAISVLGKGLNFTPTPTLNVKEEQLDMRLATNNILRTAYISPENQTNIKSSIPSKLSRKVYAASYPAEEAAINNLTNKIAEDHNGRLQFEEQPSKKMNITKDEVEGLQWLTKETREGNIAVVKADKGGALLIVTPELLEESVREKLENPDLYQKLDNDPTQMLHNELFDIWVTGKRKGFVTPFEAHKVMGVTESNNKSTSPHLKPGTSYFYPMLKIHKLNKVDLKPGVKPPARLVTALQDGISKRSDVFTADRFLKELEADYCKDLLKDTNNALSWLDMVDNKYSAAVKKNMKAFTFDFKSLYDSLKPELVKEALQHAMETCRQGWSVAKRKWIEDLVDISLRSSVGKFQDNWYLQKNGVPTIGSLCVCS